MLGWAVALTILSLMCLPWLNHFDDEGYWTAKGIHVAKVMLITLAAWGYLLWGQSWF